MPVVKVQSLAPQWKGVAAMSFLFPHYWGLGGLLIFPLQRDHGFLAR